MNCQSTATASEYRVQTRAKSIKQTQPIEVSVDSSFRIFRPVFQIYKSAQALDLHVRINEITDQARTYCYHLTPAVVGMAAPEITTTNVGFRMLAMMGWNNGEKIGVSGQGLNKPLAVIVKRTKRGLGMEKKWDA